MMFPERPSQARAPVPSFQEGRNRRQKARAAGLHPDYWYPVLRSDELPRGQVREARFWGRSFAVFRGQDGVVRALENRCAHRHLKLSVGLVEGNSVTCPYHGWRYDAQGRLTHVPHELFGKSLPRMQVPSYAVTERYGLVWLFPGDARLAAERPLPLIPELEGDNPWALMRADFLWKAHHSMIIENVSDFTHEFLHRRSKPFRNARLTRAEEIPGQDRVFVEYDTEVGRSGIASRFVNRDAVNTNHMVLCYEYPHQWSNTGEKIRSRCLVLPVDERTTRVFFLFTFDALKVPFTSVAIPHRLMDRLLRLFYPFLVKPVLDEDGFALEEEQQGYEAHHDKPFSELNPAVPLFQTLTIRKWEEYLAQAPKAPDKPAAEHRCGAARAE